MGSIISTIYSRCFSFFRRITNHSGSVRPPDPNIEKGKLQSAAIGPILSPTALSPTVKRRALLVGISYAHSQSETWWALENTHDNVDMFRNLLVWTYGYSPDEITILKDGPSFPDHLQPTRDNMIRELQSLVANAPSGDKFTFFYSGHSDQQISFDDIGVEEDGQGEAIITSDIQRIVDNELNDILVKPLPAGTLLLESRAVFDTSHSGTMLDLPHRRCNGVYVPWVSEACHYEIGLSFFGADDSLPSITDVMAWDTDPLRLRIDTQVPESTEPMRRWWSMGDSEAHPAREGRLQRRYAAHPARLPRRPATFLPRVRPSSSLSIVNCDGWCGYNPFACRVAMSLSSCSDPQRAWGVPRGSLTTVLCKYLEAHPRPSYRNLMTHVNFALHENARELHRYTRIQKEEGSGFDGELDSFRGPSLCSLSKLNMDEIFQL